MKPTQKQTIYDIADKLGVSPSTVSAALNGTWKTRRIKEETALRIIDLAQTLGYSVNLQARGLRTARSGLVGLIVPELNNRFFSDLSQSFTLEARQRGQCPIIIATQRKPDEEADAVQHLLSYSIDVLFVAGAAEPLRISEMCHAAELAHVFIDQPCQGAPSVITDNQGGAQRLTDAIISTQRGTANPPRDGIYFLGGDARLHASSRRIAGFRSAVEAHAGSCTDDRVIACGYDQDVALRELQTLYDRLGGLPAGLFLNSINVFEAFMRFAVNLPESELQETSIGCFDYEPYGSLLRFPIHMIRQRHKQLVLKAYSLFEDGISGDTLVMVEPELYPAKR